MWVIAKIKSKQVDIFKKNLKEKFQDTNFYEPKIQLKKFNHNKYIEYEKSVMENYIFCFNKKFSEEDILNSIVAKIPLGRLAKPSEIGDAVAFLAHTNSRYITGSDISVNGGLFMG